MTGFLEGKVVLDFSTLLPGPYAGLLLAQLGCRVVKVEPPGGDPMRTMNPGGFQLANAGKESVVVDLKDEAHRATLDGLLREADAVLVSSLPGTLARLELGPQQVHEVNPALVYCHVLGWSGDLRELPAHDLDVLAATGAIALGPAAAYPLGLPVADLATGALAALGIVARLSSDAGERVVLEVSMEAVLASWVVLGAGLGTASALAGPPPGPPANGGYGIFTGSDGARFSIGAVEARFWAALVSVLGLDPALASISSDDRHRRHTELNAAVDERTRTAPAASWVAQLRVAGVPAALVARPADVVNRVGGPVVQHPDGRVVVGFPDGSIPNLAPAPELGAHTPAPPTRS